LLTVYKWLFKFANSFVRKARNANSLVAEPETDFNTKWAFKVIYFGVVEEPLWDYIV